MNLRNRTRMRGQRGGSLVETSMMLVIVMVLTFWIFEMCMLLYTYVVMADAANEGVRHAVVRSGGDVAGTQAQVMEFAKTSMHDVRALRADVTFPDGDAKPPNRVRVTVTYTFVPFLKVITTPPTMHTYSEGRMITQ